MEQDIFGLDVAVEYVHLVHILHRLTDLLREIFHLFFRKALPMFDRWIKVFTEAGLEQQVDVMLIDVKMVKFDDIGMLQIRLYFEFPYELIYAQIVDLHFGDDFKRKDAPGCFMPA